MSLPNGSPTPKELRANLDARTAQMLEHVKQFVNTESPSNEPELLQTSAEFLAKVMTEVLGKAPEIIASEKGPHPFEQFSTRHRFRLVQTPARFRLLLHALQLVRVMHMNRSLHRM